MPAPPARLDDGREVRAGEAPAECFAWCVQVETRDWPAGRTVNSFHTPIGYRVEGRPVEDSHHSGGAP